MRKISFLLLVFYCILAIADYHARRRDASSIRDSFIAAALTPEITHKVRLSNALLYQAKKNRKQRKMLAGMAAHYAWTAIELHPRDPRGWATLWRGRMEQGRLYAAYAAISRAVGLDPLFVVNRRAKLITARMLDKKRILTGARCRRQSGLKLDCTF